MIDNKIIKNQDKELKLASKIREREYRKRLGLHLLLRLWLHLHENEKPSEITEPTKMYGNNFLLHQGCNGPGRALSALTHPDKVLIWAPINTRSLF